MSNKLDDLSVSKLRSLLKATERIASDRSQSVEVIRRAIRKKTQTSRKKRTGLAGLMKTGNSRK